ncbi:hypothetical protein AK812_SmicGene18378 [Symbiodinium microadriaticum]|uniref:Uncharacterized protein n=1 Tax=Symbiodinium microadriaticum TaxID=2951 RepID=A0A1Q9DV91_SYMMI|nr:hypothetical protein AK812_SmicGene18378 [Symbiodinium microadriaticum]
MAFWGQYAYCGTVSNRSRTVVGHHCPVQKKEDEQNKRHVMSCAEEEAKEMEASGTYGEEDGEFLDTTGDLRLCVALTPFAAGGGHDGAVSRIQEESGVRLYVDDMIHEGHQLAVLAGTREQLLGGLERFNALVQERVDDEEFVAWADIKFFKPVPDPGPATSEGPGNQKVLFVGGLSQQTDPASLERYFSSGQCVSFEVTGEMTMSEVRQVAQAKMGRTLIALLSPFGTHLDPISSVAQSGLQDGAVIGAIAKAGPKLQSHRKASTFAAILADGSVVTWGHRFHGGDSHAVRDQLLNVHEIYATHKALAAVKADGSVVAWGHADHGGDNSGVQDDLQMVRQVFASMQAFAALRSDGRVVTWGNASHGGDSQRLAGQLEDVREIYSTEAAFAAVRGDRSVVTWGHEEQGGESAAISHELLHVRDIAASGKAFAAVRRNGTVVSWGHPEYGGDSSAVKEQLVNVESIHSSSGAFAAIKTNGSVITWGHALSGGDCRPVEAQLDTGSVGHIYSSNKAFAALTANGTVAPSKHMRGIF